MWKGSSKWTLRKWKPKNCRNCHPFRLLKNSICPVKISTISSLTHLSIVSDDVIKVLLLLRSLYVVGFSSFIWYCFHCIADAIVLSLQAIQFSQIKWSRKRRGRSHLWCIIWLATREFSYIQTLWIGFLCI